MSQSDKTAEDRLRDEWERSELALDALLARMAVAAKESQARRDQANAEMKALLDRLDRFDEPGGAAA